VAITPTHWDSVIALTPYYLARLGRRRSKRRLASHHSRGKQGADAPSHMATLSRAMQQCKDTYKDGRIFLHSACLSLPEYALGESKKDAPILFAAPRPPWFEEVLHQLRALK
jgi:hypothetical protein